MTWYSTSIKAGIVFIAGNYFIGGLKKSVAEVAFSGLLGLD
jgi:hypothetical protein